MSLNTGMGHDHQQQRTGRRVLGVRLPVLVAIITAAVVVMIIGSCSGNTAAPAPPLPASTPTPTPTPTEPPHTHETTGAPREAWTTLDQFMLGWLATDPDQRAEALDGTTASELAKGLNQTDRSEIPEGQQASVEVVSSTTYSVLFEVGVAGLDKEIRVLLEGDPDSDHGWRVTGLEPK